MCLPPVGLQLYSMEHGGRTIIDESQCSHHGIHRKALYIHRHLSVNNRALFVPPYLGQQAQLIIGDGNNHHRLSSLVNLSVLCWVNQSLGGIAGKPVGVGHQAAKVHTSSTPQVKLMPAGRQPWHPTSPRNSGSTSNHAGFALALCHSKERERWRGAKAAPSPPPRSLGAPSRLLQPEPQLPLLLRDLHLEPLDAVLQRLPPLAHGARAQARVAVEGLFSVLVPPPGAGVHAAAAAAAVGVVAVVVVALREAPGVELAARLEGLDTARLALDLAVGAVEEVGDEGADLVAEAGLGGGEGRLGEELVVL